MYFAYRQLAAILGLHLSPKDPGMMTTVVGLSGEIDGQRVELLRFSGRAAHIRIKSPFRPPLDLGLDLVRAGVIARLSELVGSKDIQLGDEAFDAAFRIRGDEPARVQALLGPELRALLSSVNLGAIELSDTEVLRTLDTQSESVEALEQALRQTAEIARTVDRARAAVPAAAALRAHHEAWRELARELGFAGEATPLWMRGPLGRCSVTLQAYRRTATSYTFDISARVIKPVELRLDVRRHGNLLDTALAVPTIATGDATFDDTFHATTSVAARITELLDAKVRAQLIELAQRGTLKLTYPSVVLSTALDFTPPAAIPGLVESLRSLIETITDNAEVRGAYR